MAFTRNNPTRHKNVKAGLKQFKEKNIPANKVNALLERIEAAFNIRDYNTAHELSLEAKKIIETALEAHELIERVKEQIANAKKRGIDISETQRVLTLAEAAFAREDFITALERIKQIEVISAFEIKGQFNPLNFLWRFWWLLSILGFVGLIVGVRAWRKWEIKHIEQRLQELGKEEESIQELIQEAQEKTFVKQEMSALSYHEQMFHFEKRRAKIKTIRSRLRTRRIALTTPAEELQHLYTEQEHMIEQIKDVQTQRYIKKTLSKKKYDTFMNEYLQRKVEIEEHIAILQERTKAPKQSAEGWKKQVQRLQRGIKRGLREIDHQLDVAAGLVAHLKKKKVATAPRYNPQEKVAATPPQQEKRALQLKSKIKALLRDIEESRQRKKAKHKLFTPKQTDTSEKARISTAKRIQLEIFRALTAPLRVLQERIQESRTRKHQHRFIPQDIGKAGKKR